MSTAARKLPACLPVKHRQSLANAGRLKSDSSKPYKADFLTKDRSAIGLFFW
jgi:hypothetical protein